MVAKKKRPEPMDTSALKTLAANKDGSGYLKQDEADKLLSAGLIEIHPTAKDADGNPAVRLTDAGKTFAGSQNGENMTEKQTITGADVGTMPAGILATAAKPTFKIRDNIPMPARRSGGNAKGSKYPFADLQVGQSFHIPVTKEVPEPWKKHSSIASSASRKYATKVLDANGQPVTVTRTRNMKDKATGVVTAKTTTSPKLQMTRVFAIRAASPDDPDGPGAVVWREK